MCGGDLERASEHKNSIKQKICISMYVHKPPGNANKNGKDVPQISDFFLKVLLSYYLEASQKFWDHILRFLGVSLVQLKGIRP